MTGGIGLSEVQKCLEGAFAKVGFTPLHMAAILNNTEIAETLIKFDETTIHYLNADGYTPLHMASVYGKKNAIILLLKKGADPSAVAKGFLDSEDNLWQMTLDFFEEPIEYFKDLFDSRILPKNLTETPIHLIMDNVEKPVEFLQELFDSCINFYTPYTTPVVQIDYDILRSQRTAGCLEMNVIQALLNTGNQHDQRRLLLHPLVESFIRLKWNAILQFYYTMMILYGLFTIALTSYIISVYNYKDNNTDVPTWVNATLITVVYVFLTVTASMEILYYLNMSKQYLLRGEFWMKFMSIVLGTILPPIIMTSSTESEWPRHLATIALLLSWSEMTHLMSRVVKWGYYVQMFKNVAFNVLKILFTFACLLIGFALCFMIQFHNKDQFKNFWVALVKTMVMLTSEFEYDDIVSNNKDDVSLNMWAKNETWTNNESEGLDSSVIMVRLTFLLFLIFAAIVLMNLMIGVAVDDINGLKQRGNIMRLEKHVEFLASMETNKVLMKIMPQKIKRKFLLSTIKIQKRSYSCVNCNNNVAIPLYIRKAIVNIANLNEKKRTD